MIKEKKLYKPCTELVVGCSVKKKRGDERCRHHLSILSERGAAVKCRAALFAPRASTSLFLDAAECEVNGFCFETIANLSVIKIKEDYVWHG